MHEEIKKLHDWIVLHQPNTVGEVLYAMKSETYLKPPKIGKAIPITLKELVNGSR